MSRLAIPGAVAALSLSYAAQAKAQTWDTVSANTYTLLCPTKVGVGDNEFNGHGPMTTTKVGIRRSGASVYLHVQYRVKESQQDWTEAFLNTDILLSSAHSYTHFWGDSNGVWGWIPLPNGPTVDSWDDFYTDTDHFVRQVFPPKAWLSNVSMNGDNKGTDIGACGANKSYISISTNDTHYCYSGC